MSAEQEQAGPQRCGYVAIIGRPNVGKSTLLNHILGQKISITSRKPQTTRHRVLGIKTEGRDQVVFVDTPGLHKGARKAINRYMNRAAHSAIADVDVVVMVVDRTQWTDEDEWVLEQAMAGPAPVILAVNKVDLLEKKSALLPHLQFLADQADFKAILPISALNRHNIDELEQCIREGLPQSVHFFPEDQVTDRSQRFMAAEMVREKIMRQLGEELPYAITVEIEEFAERDGVLHISALIYVERDGQKRILIGKGGSRLRSIGAEARKDMEALFESKVMLKLWVKIKSGWSDDERALRSLGYDEQG
ncbi:MAG: GTPase Era [Halieaceae bacterium]|jgi:GTP-binding protein Era|nr:GTPase Era [Halieaceae bacterium]